MIDGFFTKRGALKYMAQESYFVFYCLNHSPDMIWVLEYLYLVCFSCHYLTLLEQCFPTGREKKRMFFFWNRLAYGQIKAWEILVHNHIIVLYLKYMYIRRLNSKSIPTWNFYFTLLDTQSRYIILFLVLCLETWPTGFISCVSLVFKLCVESNLKEIRKKGRK